MKRDETGRGLRLAIRPSPVINLAMKTKGGKPGPPRMTARERHQYLVGIPVNVAEQKALQIAAGRRPLSGGLAACSWKSPRGTNEQ